MNVRPLDCFVVPQLSVQGDDYDFALDEQPGFSISVPSSSSTLNRRRSLTGFLRSRELAGGRFDRRKPTVTYDVDGLDAYVRRFRNTGIDEDGKRSYQSVFKHMDECDSEYSSTFNDSNIAAVNPDGTVLARIRVDEEDEREYDGRGRGTKLIHISRLAPKYLVWPISLILEDIPLSEPVQFFFSRRNGLMATLVKDECVEEGRAASQASQGVLRVDLFVPWAGAQICTINTACLAQRRDKKGKKIEKRCLRLHDRGVVVNCGFQIVFVTVTPRMLFPSAVQGEARKSFFFTRQSYLGVRSNAEDAVEKRVHVEAGESLSCRFSTAVISRAHEHIASARLEMREHPKGGENTVRIARPRLDRVGEPQCGSSLYMARQVVSIESIVAQLLSRWYANRPRSPRYVGPRDYESDILYVDDATCVAAIGVFVKAEVRYSRGEEEEIEVIDTGNGKRMRASPLEHTQFDDVYVEFEWMIMEGVPRSPWVRIRKAAIEPSELFDKCRWNVFNPRERYEPHEEGQNESSRGVIELRPLLQPELLLRQRANRNRFFHSSQEDLSDNDIYGIDNDDSQEE